MSVGVVGRHLFVVASVVEQRVAFLFIKMRVQDADPGTLVAVFDNDVFVF